ncbi:MAG TPA: SBBP repeat-containing protein, partial [Thiolinea sp.]|nr:SBBP repeat-containing protein [Thiolinea sp.]
MYSHLLPRAVRSPSHPSLSILALSLGLLTLSSASSASPDRAASKASDQQLHSQAVLAKTPLFFEPNRGQFAKSVDFAVRTPMLELSLQDTEAHIWLPNDGPQAAGEKLVVKPVGAQVQATGWQGEEQQLGLSHYYEGNDAKQWFTDIPHYGRVKYRNLYKGIDLVYYGNPTQLEYDFVVAPHADPRQIALAYTGAQAISLTKDGDAQLTIGQQTLVQHRPVAYQMINGKRQAVDAQYVITATPEGKQTGLSFKLAAYNPEHSLVIDPILSYSSFVGGNKGDGAYSIGVDKQGAMYISGHTESSNFPGQTSNSAQGAWDAFVSKFDKAGKLVWTSFLRGSKNDYNRDIAVTEAGKVYLVGTTESANFPTTSNAYDRSLGGTWDVYVAHLTPLGKLAYSTYLGGGSVEEARSLAVNQQGDIYFTGFTYSTDFPLTTNAIDRSLSGNVDGFFAKLNAKGNSLLYSTYLGGATDDYANKIVIDSSNQAYIIGLTGSADFPVTSAAFDKNY